MDFGYIEDPAHSEQFESALHFIRALQEQIYGNGLDPSQAISSTTDDDRIHNSHRKPSSSEHHSVIKDAMMATTTIKLQPSMSIISGGRTLSSSSPSPLSASPSRDGRTTHSPRCSICPYEWDGQPPTGVGEAKIYRLNPSPGTTGFKVKEQQLGQIEVKEVKEDGS